MSPQQVRELIESLFGGWYPILVRHCRRLLGDQARAEDCAQHSFLELCRTLSRGGQVDSPKAWTLTVARRQAFRDQREAQLLDRIDSGEDEPLAPPVPDAGMAGDFEQLLELLTPREEAVLLLRLESLKYREIAERLEISASAVNTLLARGLRKLEAHRRQPTPTQPAAKTSGRDLDGRVRKSQAPN
jgi:RNA polymerase sigma-70 factor (ECF subfamily)